MRGGFTGVGGVWFPPALGFGLDTSASLLFGAMTTPPTNARKQLLNSYIAALKAAGLWSKLDAIYLFAAETSQAGLLNIKSPGTFNATLVSAPTFNADRGFTTNGSSNYVETNFNPSTAAGNFVQDSASFSVRALTTAQVNASSCGWYDGTDGTTLLFRSASDTAVFRLSQAAASSHTAGSPTLSSGAYLLAANRSGSGATQLYMNGAAMTVGSNPNQTSTALNSNNFYLGRQAASGYAAIQFASCYIGGSLTAGEHLSLAAADLAYMQAVGAA